MIYRRIIFIGAFLAALHGYAQHPNVYDPVDRALDLEDAASAQFFLKRVASTDAGHALRAVEIRYLQKNYHRAQDLLDSVSHLSLSQELIAYQAWCAGKLAYHRAETDAGLTAVTRGMKALESLKAPPLRIRAGLLSIKGFLLTDNRDFDSAEATLNEALQLYRTDSTHYYIRISDCRYGLGILYWVEGQLAEAERQSLLSKEILGNNPLDKRNDLVRVLNLLGNIYHDEGNYLKARESYSQCIDMNLHLEKDSIRLAVTLTNFAGFFLDYGNYVESERYFLQGLKFINPQNRYHLPYAAKFYQTTGKLYYEMGQPYKALTYLKDSRDFYRALRTLDATYPDCLITLAVVSIAVEAMGDAGKYLDEAQQEMAKLRNVSPETRIRYLIARSNLAAKSGQAQSLPLLQEAKSVLESEPVGNELKRDLYFDLGINNQVDGHYEQAFADLRHAREAYAEIGDQIPPLIMTIDQLGVAQYRKGALDSATYFFRYSLQQNSLPDSLAGGNGFPRFVEPFEAIVASYYLAKISLDWYQQGAISLDQLKDAESYILLGQNLINDQRKSTREEKDNINFGTSVQDFFETAIRFYFTLYRATGSHDDVERSFALSEMAKNQTMQTTLRDLRIREFAGVTQKLVQRENDLLTRTNNLEAQLAHELGYGENANADLLGEYRTAWKQEQASRSQFLDSMRRNMPDYYNLKFNNNLISLNAVQRDIVERTPDQVLVEFFVGEKNIYAHCLWGSQATLIQIRDKEKIAKLSQGLTNAIKFEASDHIAQLGSTLYAMLMSPLDSAFGRDRKSLHKMIVIPDGFLCYLPFEILQPPSKRGPHYLIEDFGISYGYSSTLLWQEFAGEPAFKLKPGEHFLGVAPEFGKQGDGAVAATRTGETSEVEEMMMNLAPLPQSRNEVKGVADYLIKARLDTTLVLGKQASEAAFKKTDLSDYSIIHLATHGVINADDPDKSGIAFSRSASGGEDGILFVREIFNLRTRADLVCLSACETGFGEVVKGEGIMGMSRAFIYSGSRNLVVSLWSVPDQSTASLMAHFYKALAQNHSIPDALRMAKIAMIKSAGSQPEKWAGFIHIGI